MTWNCVCCNVSFIFSEIFQLPHICILLKQGIPSILRCPAEPHDNWISCALWVSVMEVVAPLLPFSFLPLLSS